MKAMLSPSLTLQAKAGQITNHRPPEVRLLRGPHTFFDILRQTDIIIGGEGKKLASITRNYSYYSYFFQNLRIFAARKPRLSERRAESDGAASAEASLLAFCRVVTEFE